MVTAKATLLEEMLRTVPAQVRDLPGSILYSGYAAFTAPSPVYLMAINPGGNPRIITTTVAQHTREVLLDTAERYSAYCDERWNGLPRGAAPVQRRIRWLLEDGLGLDPRLVPSTNLVFQRTRSASEIPPHRYDECWPFHQTMTARVDARVIVCLGAFAEITRRVTEAHEVIEHHRAPEQTWIYRTPDGRVVVRGVHPVRSSNEAWKRNAQLISRAMSAARPS